MIITCYEIEKNVLYIHLVYALQNSSKKLGCHHYVMWLHQSVDEILVLCSVQCMVPTHGRLSHLFKKSTFI